MRTDLLKDALVGRTAAGERVYVTITINERDGSRQTITHERVPGPLTELTLSGLVVGKGRRNADSAGQVLDILTKVTEAEAPFTLGDVRTLHALWKRWHLNLTRAACAHMTLPEGTSYDARRNITCPVSGYVYGTAWLCEPLPHDGTGTVEGDPLAVARFIAGRTPRPKTYTGN